MGVLTQDEIKTEVRSALGNRTELDARLSTILNITQIRLARLYDWNELQSITSGSLSFTGTVSVDKFLTLPSGISKIYSFRILSSGSTIAPRKLAFVPQKRWDTEIPDAEYYTTGKPSIYTVWGTQAELWHIPGEAYSYELRTSLWPTAFDSATGSQKSDLDHKDDLIIMLGTSWAFATLREMDEADKWFGIFKNAAKNALGQDITEYERDIRPRSQETGSLPAVNPWQDPFFRG